VSSLDREKGSRTQGGVASSEKPNMGSNAVNQGEKRGGFCLGVSRIAAKAQMPEQTQQDSADINMTDIHRVKYKGRAKEIK